MRVILGSIQVKKEDECDRVDGSSSEKESWNKEADEEVVVQKKSG